MFMYACYNVVCGNGTGLVVPVPVAVHTFLAWKCLSKGPTNIFKQFPLATVVCSRQHHTHNYIVVTHSSQKLEDSKKKKIYY